MPGKKIYITFLILFGYAVSFVHAQNMIEFPDEPDSLRFFTIEDITLTGNAKTKPYILLRDIVFAKGDRILNPDLKNVLERSMHNLINSALFNSVIISAKINPFNPDYLKVTIAVKERWYIIPEPVFELYDRNYKVWAKVYNRDLERIKYGVKFKYNNFTGRRDQLRINLVNGFSKEISFSYSQPFADKKLKQGFGLAAGYARRIGVTYNHFKNGGLPRKLCDTCPVPNYKLFYSEDYFAGINYQYRNGIYDRHLFNINYVNAKVADTIVQVNPDYFYNGIRRTSYVDLNYNYSYSKVDYFAYPLIGSTFNAGLKNRLSKDGLGQLLLFANYAKHIHLKKGFYFSTILAGSMRLNQHNNSFLNMKASDLSYANIRGLEEFLLLSKNDISIRNSLRYKILDYNLKNPLKIKNHDYIPIKLYFRIFADAAYASLPNTNFSFLHHKMLRTGGFAIDFISLYDIIFRFEFSYNQITQFGFFIR